MLPLLPANPSRKLNGRFFISLLEAVFHNLSVYWLASLLKTVIIARLTVGSTCAEVRCSLGPRDGMKDSICFQFLVSSTSTRPVSWNERVMKSLSHEKLALLVPTGKSTTCCRRLVSHTS